VDGAGRRGRHRSLDDEQVRFIRSAYAEALASGREANAKHPQAKASKLVRRFTRDGDDAGLRADLVQ
jgi:hypothetical protein